MEDIFINNLKKKFKELYELANENGFVILIPNRKLINENMLNQNFYNNHIYSISKYDEQMYINLNGKVLKFFHPKFSSWHRLLSVASRNMIILTDSTQLLVLMTRLPFCIGSRLSVVDSLLNNSNAPACLMVQRLVASASPLVETGECRPMHLPQNGLKSATH